MRSFLFRLKFFIKYWLDAVGAHSLHSPFLFNFYTEVLTGKSPHPHLALLSNIRKRFQNDHRTIDVIDLGAGSVRLKKRDRRISALASITTSPEKFSLLYWRIVSYYKCRHIVELGTSIGINAMYLAKANENAHVTTFEGSNEIAQIARNLFHDNQVKNVEIIEGDIGQTLPTYVASVGQIDFALVDANHRFGPTMQYVELLMKKIHAHSIIAIDDIHSSPEMEHAWSAINAHKQVYTTIDLYRCGLIFFNPSLSKQNVVLRF